MKKVFIVLLALALACVFVASCKHDSVYYCPFCGKSGIKEISIYDKDTGVTEIHYQCQNEKCGKIFGAGKM